MRLEVIDVGEEVLFGVIGVWFIDEGENVVAEAGFRCGGERSDVGGRAAATESMHLRDDDDGD